jgi:phosphonate transport system substrate-binding protein
VATRLTFFKRESLWSRLVVLVVSLLWAAAALAADPPANPVYRFGIVPQQSATELARTWAPVLDALHAKTGLTLRFGHWFSTIIQ